MNRKQLYAVLRAEGFNERTYSLNEGNFDPDEVLCLRKEQGRWCIYYSERGIQTGKIFFDTEEAACEYFLEQMRDDPTTKQSWHSGYSLKQ